MILPVLLAPNDESLIKNPLIICAITGKPAMKILAIAGYIRNYNPL